MAPRRNLAARSLVGATVLSALIWGAAPLAASADPGPDPTNPTDYDHYGNGTRNHNIFSLESPTSNQGYQHTSTSTAGGTTSVQNAMCRHVTVCNITQKATPETATTTPVNNETVIPENGGTPAAEEVTTRAPKHNPFSHSYPLDAMMTVWPISRYAGVTGRAAPDLGEHAPRHPAHIVRHPRSFIHQRGHR
jgi:hypothetical protein